MAETEAMEPTPEMADVSDQGPQMSMSDAMDMLDEHGITAENWKDISDAIEVVHGEDETGGEMETEPGSEDQAMLDAADAPRRGR